MEKRRAQQPSTVLALLFAVVERQVHMCFVVPAAAIRAGRRNCTIPGGGIHQVGSNRFEALFEAIRREIQEEIGSPPGNIKRLLQMGDPILHHTGKGTEKVIQPFAAMLHQPTNTPRLPDEIASVIWCEVNSWADLIASMNEGKRKLVLGMMQEASKLPGLFPCVRRTLRTFLAQPQNQLALSAG